MVRFGGRMPFFIFLWCKLFIHGLIFVLGVVGIVASLFRSVCWLFRYFDGTSCCIFCESWF